MTTHTQTPDRTPEIGEGIYIPVWHVEGIVLDVRPSMMGSPQSLTVLVSEHPDDETGRWYRLDPAEYRLDGEVI